MAHRSTLINPLRSNDYTQQKNIANSSPTLAIFFTQSRKEKNSGRNVEMGERRGGGGRGRLGWGFIEGSDVNAVSFGIWRGVMFGTITIALVLVADQVDALLVEVFDFFGVLGVLFELELAGARSVVGLANHGSGDSGDGCGRDEIGHVRSHSAVLGPSS
jgi:hypothetical protein